MNPAPIPRVLNLAEMEEHEAIRPLRNVQQMDSVSVYRAIAAPL
jgi:hypothetical protein